MPTDRTFRDFEDFWPYYLGEHANPVNRWLHFCGTTAAILAALTAVLTLRPLLLLTLPLFGYGAAWIGHFIVEKNRPATFQHPLWSLRGDFRLYGRMWRGQFHRGYLGPDSAVIGADGAGVSPADRVG